MEYSIPIIILSANFSPYSERRQGCRETWVPLLRDEFYPVFAVGSPDLKAEWRFEGDILRVRCEDGYAHLANKMRLALKAVLNRFAFPWLFKCDDDTWLNPWRFNFRLDGLDEQADRTLRHFLVHMFKAVAAEIF